MKSHVSLEQNICSVCGDTFETNGVLLHKQLRATLDKHTVTGWGLCPKDQERLDEGYIALVEISNTYTGSHMEQEEAKRTGKIFYLKREAFKELFTIQEPEVLAFIPTEVGDYLRSLQINTDNTE